MTVISLFFLSLLLWVNSAVPDSPAIQQNTTNSITGRIINTSGQSLDNMRVELLDEVDMTVKQIYTTSSGLYSFRNLSQGTFTIRVHSNGVYLTVSERVTLYALKARGGSHQEQMDIVMKTKEELKGRSGPANAGTTFAQEVPDKARKIFDQAIKQLDNDKQIEQGMASLKEAIVIFPNYYAALERLGAEQVKRQEYEPARATLAKAIEVNAKSAPCLYALGFVQAQARQWPQAVESLQHSLQLAPTSSNAAFAHFYLGLALIKTGKPTEAEPHLKKACEMGGNNIPADAHMHLAQIYSNSKRYKEAADELELFLKQAPDARDAENIRNIIKQLRMKTKG